MITFIGYETTVCKLPTLLIKRLDFLKNINTFIHALKWSKVKVKIFIMLQNYYILNKCCSFEFSILQRILKKSITV